MAENGQGAGDEVIPPGGLGLGTRASMGSFLIGGKSEDDGHESLGNKLFIGAWTIEIIAASVGLFMALVQIADATQKQANDDISTTLNAILAALPFFAVAIIELTKIPLATVFYKATVLRWKVVFISGLLLTMGITFETFFLGFERYFSLLASEIYELQLDIGSTTAEVKATDDNKRNALTILASKQSVEANHRKNVATIKAQYDNEVEALNQQKSSVDEKYAGNLGPLTEEIKALELDIKERRFELIAELKNIDSDHKHQTEQLTKNHAEYIAGIERQIKTLARQLESLNQSYVTKRRHIETQFKANYAECFVCTDLIESKDKDLAALDRSEKTEKGDLNRQLSELRKKATQPISASVSQLLAERDKKKQSRKRSVEDYTAGKVTVLNKKRAELGRTSGVKEPRDVAELERINQKLTSAVERLNERQEQESRRYEVLVKGFSSNQKSIQTAEKRRESLEERLRPKCTELNKKVTTNQIYRLTKMWTGKDNACDITQDDLKLTQFVWFGSQALIVSGLGTLLAFGGLVIKFPPRPLNKGRPLRNRIRMLLVSIRRRLNAPKTVVVTKEVPVDKVVFRDVTREVVRRELVHVPLYTNDVDLLRVQRDERDNFGSKSDPPEEPTSS